MVDYLMASRDDDRASADFAPSECLSAPKNPPPGKAGSGMSDSAMPATVSISSVLAHLCGQCKYKPTRNMPKQELRRGCQTRRRAQDRGYGSDEIGL